MVTLRRFIVWFDMGCNWIDLAMRVLLGLLLLAILVLVSAQVILRWTVGVPYFWLGELSVYAFVSLAMLGAGVCLRADAHVRMTVFLDKMPPVLNRITVVAIYLLAIVYAYHLAYFGHRFAMLGARELSPTSTFVLFWPRSALTVGGILLGLQALSLLLRELAQPLKCKVEGNKR